MIKYRVIIGSGFRVKVRVRIKGKFRFKIYVKDLGSILG
jgi:hypothetical protein